PFFDLESWNPPRGDRGKKLRWAVNHARRAGVRVDEYRPGDGQEAEVLALLERWRDGLGRAEPQGLMRTRPLDRAELKRLFIARRDGRAEAVLSCARLSDGG